MNPGLQASDGARRAPTGSAGAGHAARMDAARVRARFFAVDGTAQGTYRLLQDNGGALLLLPDELSQSWVGRDLFSTAFNENRAALVSLANGGDLNQTFANAVEVRLKRTHMCLLTGVQVRLAYL